MSMITALEKKYCNGEPVIQRQLSIVCKKHSIHYTVSSKSFLHSGQYHFPSGILVSPTQWRWNHLIWQLSLSQQIISPYDI